jgi:hypothetical protein
VTLPANSSTAGKRGGGTAAGGARARLVAAAALSIVLVVATVVALVNHGASAGPARHPAQELIAAGSVRAAAPSWRLKLTDNFEHGLTGGTWDLYSGPAIGDPGGFFAPSHASVVNGILTLDSYRDPSFGDRWVSGGLSSGPAVRQTYGKYLVRARMDPGQGIIGAVLLWPAHGSAPPEINFAKDVGYTQTRDHFTASVLPTGGLSVGRATDIDWSNWQTVGLEWTPGQLVFTVNGKAWASIRGGDVPAVPMQMDIQSQAATCGPGSTCPGASTPSHVRLEVAWVRIYAYHGRR